MAPTRLRALRITAIASLVIMLSALFIGVHQPSAGKLFVEPWDKLAHIIFYSALTVFTAIGFPKMRLLLLAIVILLIGVTDEAHQIFVPGRHPGFDDLAADGIGCAAVLFLLKHLRKKYNFPF
ncbi:MAG: VanZ family protein [Methylotenera sp.]|uniref:VanZ family protein n=1 Tax=Methylotenera sp. TaxID=2051956 RepID=UPI0018064E6A|nr:VanZ family protein [Methylotenera sp.]NOU25210.1 VanZ family protein [Methylotenera sp.]